MVYQNMEIHNIGELIPCDNGEGVRWLRVPQNVYDKMESDSGKRLCRGATGVELRFVMKSDTVTLRMKVNEGTGVFHVFRGSIQGGWEDHELKQYVTEDVHDFVIQKSGNLPVLRRITEEFHQPFAPEVVRVIFDRGTYTLLDVIGDVAPPEKTQLPKKTLLSYGSSITHGSNAIDASHTWVSVLAHRLRMDARNLGMAGSCRMEPAIAEYIAKEGELGHWDVATLELGINVLDWEKDKIIDRVSNTIRQVAGRNAGKPVFVISPFYCMDDYAQQGRAEKWRRLIAEVVQKENFANVTYINGLELLGDMSLISADEVHPNIFGVAQIADRLEAVVRKRL